jgi:WD40 repeat protein/serine/threonine protein kinase/tetratricopeptide (TPR) repeat protein
MKTSSGERNPVELLAEEFLDRKRRGEQPTLREYVERHPELADEIRDLFPALLMMEDLGESSGGSTGAVAAGNGAMVETRLQRLGDYRILREIGRGGMGIVYEAEQESLGRRVALKVLSAGALLDPKQVRRFEREAKAAARLHHTNIVPVFGVGHQGGHRYFVMQFITGLGLDVVLDDLRRLRQGKSEAKPAPAASAPAGLTAADVARSLINGQFAASGPIPMGETVTDPIAAEIEAAAPPQASRDGFRADSSSVVLPGSSDLSALSDPDLQYYRSVARIGIQVAEALEYANRQGVLHRDVKPSNLLLDNHGNVWVADFGLAKTAEADDLTHTGDILGTVRYMAPERFQGKCDARSDVYSLGLTLYELVALRPAYQAADRHELIERVLHEEPERLKKLVPSVPRDVETIIAKAIAREPAGRYATSAALAEDLKRFVEDRPIRARRVSSAERLARWCRRNRGLAASLGATAAALVVAVVVSLLYADRQARHAVELKTALTESNRRLAILNFERGQAAFEKGHVGEGMLWTVESLRMAALAGAEDWKRVALANLSAWRSQLRELRGVFPHGGLEHRAAFSPDGQTILTACMDKGGTVRLWDAATGLPHGQPPVVLAGQVGAFSPDGKTVLTGCEDGTVRLWDAATGRPLGSLVRHPAAVNSVAFGPDGKTILTGCEDGAARLWDAATGRPLVPPMDIKHGGWFTSAFSPDGKPIGSTRSRTTGADWFIAAFSPDGKTIATASEDGTARLWDAATGRTIGQPMEHSDLVNSVAFSPDGKMIITGSWDRTARLWDASTGLPLGPPIKHPDAVRLAAFSPDGRTIVTGCQDHLARLWDAATGTPISQPLEHRGTVYTALFSADGRSILTGSRDGMARLWDGEVSQPVGRVLDYGSPAQLAAFSRDGKTILTATGDGQVQLWDVASGHRIGPTLDLGTTIHRIALSPNGTTILTGSEGQTARLWDVATGRPLGQPMECENWANSRSFSPDGKMFLTGGGEDGTARLWDAATGRPLRSLEHSHTVQSVAFSPDSKTILTGCWDKMARLWDAATGRPLGQPMPHDDPVGLVAFSPDGKTILTGSGNTTRLWDAMTGRPLGPPQEHSVLALRAAFSPDGRTILAQSSDETVRLWDVATGRPIGPPLKLWDYVQVVAFSPDGRSLLAGGSRTARIWDAPAPLPDDPPRLAAWVEAAIRLRLDDRGSIQVLDGSAWLERRRWLESLGGPPPADPAPRLDPILFGANPAARGDGWKERGLWDRAEAAYAEAIRARPLNQSVWEALARMHVERGNPNRATATIAEAVRMMPDDVVLRRYLGATLLASGDLAGWRVATAALLDRFGGSINPWTANQVARSCVLVPEVASDPGMTVRLAETAVRGAVGPLVKSNHLNTLGAALYRAGRCDEAIQRLEEAIQDRGGQATCWAFLAMAQDRLGHHEGAFRWLDRLRKHQPAAPAQFWDELEIRLLRSEAEAVILYDPIFPADPFAR